MPINVTFNESDVKQTTGILDRIVKNLEKEVNIAAWKTARKGKSVIAKQVTNELAATQKVVKQQINTERGKTYAAVSLRKSGRIPLRDFGARQTKVGVSYRISKSQGRKILPGAFQGPRPGLMKASWKGNAFRRVGKQRLPIVKLKGPSPWGVHLFQNQQRKTRDELSSEFLKQLLERIRYNRLKQSGAI